MLLLIFPPPIVHWESLTGNIASSFSFGLQNFLENMTMYPPPHCFPNTAQISSFFPNGTLLHTYSPSSSLVFDICMNIFACHIHLCPSKIYNTVLYVFIFIGMVKLYVFLHPVFYFLNVDVSNYFIHVCYVVLYEYKGHLYCSQLFAT